MRSECKRQWQSANTAVGCARRVRHDQANAHARRPLHGLVRAFTSMEVYAACSAVTLCGCRAVDAMFFQEAFSHVCRLPVRLHFSKCIRCLHISRVRMLSEFCRQTYALVKKGVLVRSRAPLRFAVEALAPIVAALFLVLLYSTSISDSSVPVPVGTGKAFQLKDAAFFATHQGVKDAQRAYSGTSSPLQMFYSVCCKCTDTVKTQQLVSNAMGFSPTLIDAADAASTCQPSKCLAVVLFSECSLNSLNWNYTIRMPSSLVANTSLIVASGPTSEADPIKSGGTNAYKPTRVASYLVNGFVSIQAAINRQILTNANPAVAW